MTETAPKVKGVGITGTPVSVGEAAKTVAPVPVVEQAESAVALLQTFPVTVVVKVIAGVVVAVATVPAKPFPLTTDKDVTVPLPLLPPPLGAMYWAKAGEVINSDNIINILNMKIPTRVSTAYCCAA